MKAKDYKSGLKPIWCPGCGDYGDLAAFTQAIAELGLDPNSLVITSGIGCSGRFSHFVKCYAFHTAHGRALPTAIGVKAANPELTVFAVGGDGDGLGIGGGHIPHAARKNPDITYLLLDNSIYGLTKGQSSPTTPLGMVTGTAPFGMVEKPLDPILIFLAYQCSFVARGFSSDVKRTANIIKEAVQHRGFSMVQLISPCPTFNRVVTFDSVRERVAPIPEDHDPTDLHAAITLALDEHKIYTGVFYRRAEPTLEDHVKGMKEAAEKAGLPDTLRGVFDVYA